MKVQASRRLPSENATPRVTVVVPCYNYGHYLAGCVDSIVSQPGVETQVLIVDDASPDGSGEVADALAAEHANVRSVRHTTNRGHIATYNEGLATVDSDYVVLLSADDLLAPGALGRATALMEHNPSVGLVYGNPKTFADEAPPAARSSSWWSTWKGDHWVEAQFRRAMSIVYSPEAVVRTSVHHEAGYYRPELPHSGDLELWLRIAAIADVGRVNGPDQAYRRVHPNSMMQTQYASVITDLVKRDDAYESFLASSGYSEAKAGALRSTVRRAMSAEAVGWAITLLDRLPETADDIAQALEFARQMDPNWESRRVGREFAARRGVIDRGRGKVPTGATLDAGIRDLASRVRWRRWRYFGV
jgi:hypothetical protein